MFKERSTSNVDYPWNEARWNTLLLFLRVLIQLRIRFKAYVLGVMQLL